MNCNFNLAYGSKFTRCITKLGCGVIAFRSARFFEPLCRALRGTLVASFSYFHNSVCLI